MKILDRYMLKGFFLVFCMGLGTIAVLFLVLAVFDNLSQFFVDKNVPVSQIALRYLCEEPRIIYMAMPMAVLISVAIVLGLLEQRNELVVIKSAGVSLLRLSIPLLLCSAAITLVMFILGNHVVPPANAKVREIESVMKGEKRGKAIRSGDIWYIKEKKQGGFRAYRIVRLNRKTNEAKGFRLYEFGKRLKLKKEVYAAGAVFADKEWKVLDARVWDYREESEASYREADELEINIPEEPRDFRVRDLGAEEMSSKSIRRHLKHIRRYGLDDRDFWVELRLRQALPFAAIIMALLAVPFALRPSRSSSITRNLLFAVIIGFAYFALMGESISLAKNGTFPPAFGAWIANAVFGVIGALLFSGTRQ